MQFRMHVKNQDKDWWEEMDKPTVTDLKTAKQTAKDIVQYYNATLYHGDKPRVLLGVEMGGAGKRQHQWRKMNLTTIIGRGGQFYDIVCCSDCGCKGKRFGVSDVKRDRAWRAKKWIVCPDREE